MVHIVADTSELDSFKAQLEGYPATLQRHVRPVVERGALNVKNDLRDRLRASRHFKGAAQGVSYDVDSDRDGYFAVIGPDKESGIRGGATKGPGALGNIAYFGTSRGGGTVESPIFALQREVPKFEQNLLDVAEAVFPNG